MHDDNAFLRKLLENPADDTVRLVYADWLDEHDDEESKAKAQFLRLTVRPPESGRTAGRKKRRQTELQSLAAKLPTDWLAIVSRLKVEGCRAKAEEHEHQPQRLALVNLFEFVCDKRWDEMATTEDDTIRHCKQCKQNVHYCDTIVTAREHAAKGHCVAVDLGIIRSPGDINSIQFSTMWVGRPSAADLAEERKKNELDAVAREREEQKRKAK
jgi:uncharacterized protein (TIGR02996 family)